MIILKSGSIKALEPSGPVQACNGIALNVTLPLVLLFYLLQSFLAILHYA